MDPMIDQGWNEPHDKETCICTTCAPAYWETWTEERESQMLEMFKRNGVREGSICEECDKVIAFDRDPSFHNQPEHAEICLRTHPFCLNHAHKVDWRERCLQAEAKLAKVSLIVLRDS